MRYVLYSLLLLATTLRADHAQLPPDAQRAMKEYDAAVDVAKKRLVAQLQTVMQSATTRGQLDAAVAVRNKIAELAPGAVVPVGAPVATVPAAGAAAGGDGQVFSIDGHDDKGTLLGPAKRGSASGWRMWRGHGRAATGSSVRRTSRRTRFRRCKSWGSLRRGWRK